MAGNKVNSTVQQTLTNAMQLCVDHNFPFVAVDHFGYALLERSPLIFERKKINKEEFLQNILKTLKGALGAHNHKSQNIPPVITSTLRLFLINATVKFNENKECPLNSYSLLAEIMSEFPSERSFITYTLLKNNITKEFLLDLAKEVGSENIARPRVKKINPARAREILEEYATNLNELAEEGRIGDVIGRDKELSEIEVTLARRVKNNIILVGDPGVGKTAIVEGLAKRIVEGQTSEFLKNAVVYSVEVGKLIAGTRFRGDLEENLINLIEAFSELGESGEVLPICFIDEIHMIVSSGGGGNETKNIDIANILKPALQKGTLRVIGATTYDEFKKHFEKDGALMRRFRRFDILEPSVEDTIKIVKGTIDLYEDYHGVRYDEDAIEKAVRLAARYVYKSKMPDKVFDIIDLAGARQKVHLKENTVKSEDIVREISKIANVPVEKITRSKKDNLKYLREHLKSVIFGQDHAIDEIVNAVLISQAGMKDPEKPECSFLFNGPTGVGKTEIAKQLAKFLEMEFVRIDMSEFMEKHSVAKLVGAPPGYVGYSEGNAFLIDAVDKNPHSVILFDEIEKAHPDVWNLLLQVLDHGKLRGSNNKEVSFRNCIIILTGNIGSREAQKPKIGFGDPDNTSVQEERVREVFAPEFLNRLTAVIQFNSLNEEICKKIVEKFIREMEQQLSEKNVEINVTDRGMDLLIEKGFSKEYGARNLARTIDSEIKRKIAPEILFGELVNGGVVLVDAKDGEFDIKCIALDKSKFSTTSSAASLFEVADKSENLLST